MAISNAVTLANFTSGDALTVDSQNDRVGIASTQPTSTLTVGGDTLVTGVVTATSFVGDGAGITNAGSTLNASSGTQRVVVTSQTSGVMTAVGTNADITYNTSTNTLSATNISATTASFSGNVSIGGTLTYEDVTNVDSVGLVTATSGIIASGIGVSVSEGGIRVTGVVTATSFAGDGSALTGIESWNQFDTWLYGGG